MRTSIQLDQEPHPQQGYIVRALLKIEGDAPSAANRTPLNISVVLDRSGSMHGAKLHHAREAAAMLVERLAPEDIVSVVAYDTNVSTVSAPAASDGVHVSAAIRRIDSGGSTNLSGGLLKGRDYVARNVRPQTANRVIMLTDGHANVGITDPDRLVGLCATANEQGIRTTTIGFGSDYDEALLQRMANAGGGNMHYIEHADQAVAVFAEEITGLLSLAAQNLTVSVIPASATQAVAVHHAYARHDIEGGMQLELGDLYAREPKLVLLEFLVFDDVNPTIDIATLVVEGAVVNADGSISQQEIVIPFTTSLETGPVSNPEVRRELLLLEAARIRREVVEDQARGEFDVASEKMRAMANKLRETGLDDAIIQEETADLVIMADQMQRGAWTVAETKYSLQRAYDSSKAMHLKKQAIARSRRPKE